MAVSPALLDQILSLDEQERLDLAEVILTSVEEGDDLDPEERARLHASIARSEQEIKMGRGRDLHDVIHDLRARSR